MSTATAGRAREYKVRNEMIDAGWEQVMRSAGSKGAADLAMAHEGRGLLVLLQVGTASKSIGPADRARLVRLARLCSALPVLATAGGRKATTYWIVGMGPASTWDAWSP